MVHVLNDLCVAEVCVERVSHPVEVFSDIVGVSSLFIQEGTCPNLQGMGGILVPVSSGNARLFLFTNSLMRVAILLAVMYTRGVFLVQ